MVNTPLAGTPGRGYSRNPTLLPNFDKPYASGSGTVGLLSPAAFLQANPRTNATATATIGGTVTTGDILTLELTNGVFQNVVGNIDNAPLSSIVSHSYTVLAGDTVGTIAEAFAKLFNDDSALQGFDIEVDAGGASGAVLTFNHPGPIGNLSVISVPSEETVKITIAGTALTNDALYANFAGPQFAIVAPASAQATIGGTPAATDTVPITFTNSGVSGLPITKTYTVVAGDTVNSIAIGLAALINSDTTLVPAGISAYADDGVVFISHNGAIGNNTVLTSTPTHGGGGSETCTFTNSGTLAGGFGIPGQSSIVVNFPTTTGNTATQMATGLKNAINASPSLAALSVTATSSSGVITITIPATDDPATVTSWANTIIPQATITGSIAAADVLNITITNAAIAGGSATVSYTAIVTDTTTTIATGLKNAVNSNQSLVAAGITATSATNVVSFQYQAANGAITFSQSVSPGSETITLSTTPTETATVATNATETITLAPTTGKLSGGTGPVIPVNNFTYSNNGITQAFWIGKPELLGFDVIQAMVNQGLPIV